MVHASLIRQFHLGVYVVLILGFTIADISRLFFC